MKKAPKAPVAKKSVVKDLPAKSNPKGGVTPAALPDNGLLNLNPLSPMLIENSQYAMVSGIMKTKHDTAKNAINNVR